MIAALLALTLFWTVPATRENGTGYVPREARVYRHVQSPAWVAMHPAMQLDGDVWAATWPVCAWEARAILVATIPLGWPDVGRRMTWTNPKADSTTAFYYVTTVATDGTEAKASNEVGR